MRRLLIALAAIACLVGAGRALADLTYTQGSGTTIFDFVCFTTKHCSAHTNITSAGTEIFTAAVPAQVSLANTGVNATAVKVDGSAATQPVSGTLTANQGTANATPWNENLAQMGGTAINSGCVGALNGFSASVPATVCGVFGSYVLNASPNGAHNTANSPTVNLATDVAVPDPCTFGVKTNVAIATALGTTQLVAPSGSTQVYVCSLSLIAAATAVVNLVGGTGATCTTGTPVAALGSTTAASGMSLAANGGLTLGSGAGTVVRTTTAGHGLCLIQSGTTALAGNATVVQQ